MSIKHTMRTPIAQDPNMVKAVVNEANDGLKATPAELVIKAMDDSTFTQVNESNPLPVKMSGGVELNVDPSNPLPVTGAVQLTGREVEQITLLDALAFTGTVGSNPIAVIPFNAQKYKDFEISIINTLSDTDGNPIPVAVGFVNNGASEVYLEDGTRALYSYYVADNRVYSEIPATGRLYYLSDVPITGKGTAQGKRLNTPNIWKLFKANNNTPQITFGFVDRSQEAASGSLSCWLEGVPN